MLYSADKKNVSIRDDFFAPRIRQAKEITVPYMWDTLNRVDVSGCISNFQAAAGLKQDVFHGFRFQDSDIWKFIEGAAYALNNEPNEALEAQIDGMIELAEKAQTADGYLDTYYILGDMSQRFTNLRDNHELYVAGHMFEAACAYYSATGKRRLLDIASRFADCIDRNIGDAPDKLHGYPGHEEIEMGLARLYRVTGNERYLRLAEYFLNERGQQPLYFEQEREKRGDHNPHRTSNSGRQWDDYSYFQAEIPVRDQTAARGHAVRQCYLLAGMAEVAALNGDRSLFDAADRVFDNIISRQMYVTGGVGATHQGEAFSLDYDLPPENCYNETCASIALIMTAQRLNRLKPNGKYGDIVEKALYNGILSGISLDGTKYFYMNPLEVWPERCEKRQDMEIDDERKGWFGCACCPPNVLRTLTGLSDYLFTADADTLYVDQYISCDVSAAGLSIALRSGFPYDGNVSLCIVQSDGRTKKLCFRVPGWAENYTVQMNGETVSAKPENGYLTIEKIFSVGDSVTLNFPMRPRMVYASQNVPNYAGKAALQRGPLIYCMEECDNGKHLWSLKLTDADMREEACAFLKGNALQIRGTARKINTGDGLYSFDRPDQTMTQDAVFVPYFAWGNRGKGEMTVWFLYEG